MNRIDETGVGAVLHVSVLTYEANLLADHVNDHPEMTAFSRAVNAAVQQYMLDRIQIITEGVDQ